MTSLTFAAYELQAIEAFPPRPAKRSQHNMAQGRCLLVTSRFYCLLRRSRMMTNMRWNRSSPCIIRQTGTPWLSQFRLVDHWPDDADLLHRSPLDSHLFGEVRAVSGGRWDISAALSYRVLPWDSFPLGLSRGLFERTCWRLAAGRYHDRPVQRPSRVQPPTPEWGIAVSDG